MRASRLSLVVLVLVRCSAPNEYYGAVFSVIELFFLSFAGLRSPERYTTVLHTVTQTGTIERIYHISLGAPFAHPPHSVSTLTLSVSSCHRRSTSIYST